MPKSIILNDSEIAVWLSHYEIRAADLAMEVIEARKKASGLEQAYYEVQAMIKQLKGEDTGYEMNETYKRITESDMNALLADTMYPESGSWWDKIRWIIVQEKKVMTGNDIISAIYEQEPTYRNAPPEVLKKNQVNIFSTLTNKFKDNELGRIKSGAEYKYGFKEWFEGNGLLRTEYINESQLSMTGNEDTF